MKKIIEKVVKYLPMSLKATLARNAIRIDPGKIEGLEFKVAQGTDELYQAYSLVGKAFYDEGYMTENKPRIQSYNTHPESTTFVVKEGSKVIATMSIMQDAAGLSLDTIYKKELDILRNQNRKIVEVGALATDRNYRGSGQMIPMGLNQLSIRYAQHLGIDDFVIGIHPKHEHIYRGILLFEGLGNKKTSYKHVNGAPVVCLRSNLNTMEEVLKEVYKNKGPERNVHDFIFNPDFNFSSIKTPQWTEEVFKYFKNDIIGNPATQTSEFHKKRRTSKNTVPVQSF